MPEQNLLKETVEVTVNGDTFEFQIPSYYDELKIGTREKNIRREIEIELGGDPTSTGDSLDGGTNFMVRTAATFEILLRKSSATWPYTKGMNGSPVVDFKKWPKDKVGDAISVGVAFNAEIARFRSGGLSNGDASSAEAMEGQPNIESFAVRPNDPSS